MSNPLNFIREFLYYIENIGIYDEFDKDANKMVMSEGVRELAESAMSYLPAKLKPYEAMQLMRDLTPAERDNAIAETDKERIVDMRKEFQKRMSINNGAQGIVVELVRAMDRNDFTAVESIMKDAVSLVKGPENNPLEK